MSKTLKAKLKTNIKALVKKHSVDLERDKFDQFKMSILAAISATLLKSDFVDQPVKNANEFIDFYSSELEFINNHFEILGYEIDISLFNKKEILEIVNIVILDLIQGENVEDDLLAWMYQYFNIGNSNNYLSNTQFFTEKYMIQYLVDTNLRTDSPDIKVIDLACGGGNFLIYVFDKIVNAFSVDKESITVKAVETALDSIYGYDIDPNLTVLTAIGLKIKIMKQLSGNEKVDLEILKRLQTNIFTSQVKNKIGSLDVTSDEHILVNVEQTKKVDMKELMADQTYDYVFTNPPFQGIKGMDKDLKEYLIVNYPKSKGDLCNAFIERSFSLLKPNGKSGVVSQTSWMFLDSYSCLRKKILSDYHIVNIVDLGSNSFADLSGEKSNVALVTFKNEKPKDNTITSVLRLKYYSKTEKPEVLISKKYKESQLFEVIQRSFLNNEGYTIEYLSFGKIKSAFENLPAYRNFGIPMQGTSTGDNNKFIDYHWNRESDNWTLVSKGGSYCKWNGLNIYKVLWGNEGEDIKKHPSSALRNIKYFERTDLVYSDTGTSGLSVRLLKENQIFIASGPGIRDLKGYKYAHLALLNSRLFSYFLRVLTPKLTIAAGYIASIPTLEDLLFSSELSEIGKKCAKLKDSSLKNIVISYEFQHPDYTKKDIIVAVEQDIINDLKNELQRLNLEKKLETIVMTSYGFNTEEIEHIYEEVGYCAMDAVKEKKLPKVEWLDKYYSKALNRACEVTISKIQKHHMGLEGILEALAIEYGYSPELIYSYLKEHVSELDLTKEIYLKDYIHKIILFLTGYRNPSITDVKKADLAYVLDGIFRDYKVLDSDDYDKIKNWVIEEFNEWHLDAFKNSPIIQYDHKADRFIKLKGCGGILSGK